MVSALFRPEAVEGQRGSWLGEVRLVRPLSLSLLTAAALCVATLIVALLFVGEYTRKLHLAGALVASSDGLRAVLYAPPATIALMRPGQAVLLHYEAFATQSAAHGGAKIVQVDRTPTALPDGAPAYRVTVTLGEQSVLADGRAQPLVAGMRVDAEVLLERRRLVDWLFAPAVGTPGRG